MGDYDYEDLRQRHLEDIFSRVPEHLARLTWPRDDLEREREGRLRDLVRVAKERSPWHALRLARFDPDRLTEEGLRELPTMTKDDLMENFDEIVTDRRINLDLVNSHIAELSEDAYLLDEFHAVASGGSSGKRGVFVYGWEGWATVCLTFIRWFVRDRTMSPELAEIVPSRTASVTAQRASHGTFAMGRTITSPMNEVDQIPVTLPLGEIVSRLNRFQPHVLVAYASILPALVNEALAGRLAITPLRVASTSEPLLPEVRQAAEETWGVPVGNSYGVSEGGGLGMPCFRDHGMHLAEDLWIIEPVDLSGNLVPPGETAGKVFITNLFNTVQPLIRYELTDEVTVLDEPCPCGSTHRRFADIQGRLDDLFTYSNGITVHPHVFRSALSAASAVREYQVHQTPEGAEIMVVTIADLDQNALAKKLEEALASTGLKAPRVTVRTVPEIERQESGKLRRFVPLSGSIKAIEVPDFSDVSARRAVDAWGRSSRRRK